MIDNLESFAKVYGYVRYFHPSDEASDIDWELLAIYGAKKVERCKTQEELKKALLEIFRPVAPLIQIEKHNKISFDSSMLVPPSLNGMKVITWQHLGLGMGHKNSIYQSARLNRKQKFRGQSTFGSVFTKIPVQKYAGLPFKLSANTRMIEGGGAMHLWVRIEDKNSNRGFFNNMQDQPIKDTEARQYEITGTLDSDAESAFFGGFLSHGDIGELDEFEFKVLLNNEWTSIFNEDFDNPSDSSLFSFEPGIGRYDSGIDGYKFKIQKILPGDQALVISKSNAIEVGEVATAIFEKHAQIGECIKKDINSELACIIPLALYGDDNHTYPQVPQKELMSLKEELKTIEKSHISGSNLYVRLADITITWNIFQHFFPYSNLVEVDWLSNLRNTYKNTYNDHSEYDFLKTLQKFTAPLKDGHINVYNSKTAHKEAHVAPIDWEWIEGELVITQVMDSLPLKQGSLVKMINGIKPSDYFVEIYKYISAGTKGYMQHRASLEALRGKKNTELTLLVEDFSGRQETLTINRSMTVYDHFNNKHARDVHKEVAEGIYYIDLDQISMEKITEIMPELEASKVIICDLRGYPNGNDGLIEHLLTVKDTSDHWMKIPEIIYPDQENIVNFKPYNWSLEPKSPHINAEIIFIIDGRAISYAESYMGFIDHYDLATIIGQPTAGTNGNINPFTLPGDYRISWTGMWVEKHDGSQHYGVGTLPDITVDKTISGIRENRDEFLEKAIEIAKEKTRQNGSIKTE
ncbi:hypothetical protein GCM10009122_30290 [Fulvivirga kasyanovii]|nr:S41 family peptidase [Fulvivirga kasyanovii]